MACSACSAQIKVTGKAQLEGDYSDPVRICCTPGWLGTCTLTTEGACGGFWEGNFTTCTQNAGQVQINNTCEPYGACCTAGEVCTWENQDDCEAGGRTYIGDGTSCSTEDICADPMGVCCRGGACEATIESNCTDGNWSTGGSCSPNPCPDSPSVLAFL